MTKRRKEMGAGSWELGAGRGRGGGGLSVEGLKFRMFWVGTFVELWLSTLRCLAPLVIDLKM